MASHPIIVDIDPGMGVPYADIDDNLAVLFALGSNELDLKLISIVAGNVPAHVGVQSIDRTLGFVQGDVPVSIGSRSPLFRPYSAGCDVIAARVPGIEYNGAFEPASDVSGRGFALCDMAATLEAAPGPVTIVAVGPLTNIALLLHQRPDLHEKIDSVVIMGGAITVPGNITPFAEFNIWIDPDAAEMVFRSPVPKVLVGLDVTTTVGLSAADFDPTFDALANRRFSEYAKPAIEGWIEVIRHLAGSERFNPHDPIALAWLVDPTLFEAVQMDVSVDVRTGKTSGRPDAAGTTAVCLAVDADRFKTLFFERLGRVALREA